jgi:hypothetical protein
LFDVISIRKNESGRATGMTDYLTDGVRIEVAQTHGRALERENHRALRPAQR